MVVNVLMVIVPMMVIMANLFDGIMVIMVIMITMLLVVYIDGVVACDDGKCADSDSDDDGKNCDMLVIMVNVGLVVCMVVMMVSIENY